MNPYWIYVDDDDLMIGLANIIKKDAIFNVKYIRDKWGYLLWCGYKEGFKGPVAWKDFLNIFSQELEKQENERFGEARL